MHISARMHRFNVFNDVSLARVHFPRSNATACILSLQPFSDWLLITQRFKSLLLTPTFCRIYWTCLTWKFFLLKTNTKPWHSFILRGHGFPLFNENGDSWRFYGPRSFSGTNSESKISVGIFSVSSHSCSHWILWKCDKRCHLISPANFDKGSCGFPALPFALFLHHQRRFRHE